MFPLFAHTAPTHMQTVSLHLTNTDKHTAHLLNPSNLPLCDYCRAESTSIYNLSAVYVQFFMMNSENFSLLRFAARLIGGVLDYKALIDA